MSWTLRRTTSPQSQVVSLDEAKAHLRVGGTGQDELIALLVEAATEQFERDINRALIQTTWVQTQDCFPSSGKALQLHIGAAQSITSIAYLDEDGASQTYSAANYTLDQGRNAITCTDDDNGWPDTLSVASKRDTVTVTFVCGTTDTNTIPRIYKQAILLMVGKMYFDPAMENGVNTDNGRTYELLVNKLMRSSYP